MADVGSFWRTNSEQRQTDYCKIFEIPRKVVQRLNAREFPGLEDRLDIAAMPQRTCMYNNNKHVGSMQAKLCMSICMSLCYSCLSV
jgi:hypothetical protein